MELLQGEFSCSILNLVVGCTPARVKAMTWAETIETTSAGPLPLDIPEGKILDMTVGITLRRSGAARLKSSRAMLG